MSNVANRVLAHASTLPEGTPVTSACLAHVASRSGVDAALRRLTREGRILRVTRGVYVRMVEGRFGMRAPSTSSVVAAFADMMGEEAATHGAMAANALGLTEQVPMREIFVTTGPDRRLGLGRQVVELRHVPGWWMTLAGHPGGEVVRALAWLGPAKAPAAVAVLKSRVPALEAQAIAGKADRLPEWLAEQIRVLAA